MITIPPFRWMKEVINLGCDSLMGVKAWQLTSQHVASHNVYCEERYTSVNGSRIAFMRFPNGYGCGGHELWVADLSSLQVAFIGPVAYPLCTSNMYSDWLYYAAPPEGADANYCSLGIYELNKPETFTRNGGPQRLMRLNLSTLEQEEIFRFEDCPPPTSQSVSPDGSQFVSVTSLGDNMFGLYRVDINKGKWEVFHEHPEIMNPHLQFEPGTGNFLLVQHNRGGEWRNNSTAVSTGEEGATIYLIDMVTGKEIPLPVGKPYTGLITGHECWIGKTGRILLSIVDGTNSGLIVVNPKDNCVNTLTRGLRFNHVSSSTDGCFFVTDQWDNAGFGRVWIGSIITGRYLPLCDSQTSRGPYWAEPFPYLTPDLKYVIYNSNVTGISQVYAAEVPAHFLHAIHDNFS